MNRVKFIFNTVWGLLAFFIAFSVLRIITKASYNDFSGKGTIIYATIFIVYVVITIILSIMYSKKRYIF